MSRNNVQRERLGRFPRAGTRSAVTPSVWASPSRRGPTTAWRGTSATCWATAAPAWRSESRACMKTWPGTPTGQGGQDGCRSKSRPGHYGSRVCVCECVCLSFLNSAARSFLPEATRCGPSASPSTSRRTPASRWSPTWCQTCPTWA